MSGYWIGLRRARLRCKNWCRDLYVGLYVRKRPFLLTLFVKSSRSMRVMSYCTATPLQTRKRSCAGAAASYGNQRRETVWNWRILRSRNSYFPRSLTTMTDLLVIEFIPPMRTSRWERFVRKNHPILSNGYSATLCRHARASPPLRLATAERL